jgi:hypothetical protein
VTTLARLPFRLGLGRVMDAIFIFRPLRPICILVRTQILFALCMIWIFVCIFGFLTRGVLVVIYSFVGSIMNLCNVATLIPPRIMCMLRRAYFAWWCVSKATSCELWRDCCNSQGANFGASQVVSEPRFCR